jgi:isocitrate dehydrogenase kinase/phosphatase
MNLPRRFARARPRHVWGKMNNTEAAYAALLTLRKQSGEVAEFYFERVTLKLADDTRYTPDFLVIGSDELITFVEVKGFLRDDARVKFKVAADQYPWAKFLMVRKVKGGWETLYEC